MRILGLDIGSTSVKAVEINSTFRRFDIHDYYERPVPQGSHPMEVASLLIKSLVKKPNRIITTLRSNKVTYRNLQLPTKDRRAIESSINFELEDDLPFASQDLIFDHTLLSSEQNQSQVHVAATLRKNIEQYLTLLQSANIDPDIITTESSAYRCLLNRVLTPEQYQAPQLLIQIGHEHTTLYGHYKGLPLICRDIPWGSRELSIAMSKHYHLTLEDAERAKLTNGFILPPSQRDTATPDQRHFSETIDQVCMELIREIKQASLAIQSLCHDKVQNIFLSGAGSLLPGLGPNLAEHTRIATFPLPSLSKVNHSGVSYTEHTDATCSLALGTALVGLQQERSHSINFRKKEFAKAGASVGFSLDQLKGPILTIGIASIVTGCLLMAESSFYQSETESIDKNLEKSIKAFFPNAGTKEIKNYISSTSSLKKNVDTTLNQQREVVRLLSHNTYSPFDFLNSLSSTVNKNTVVDLMNFDVGLPVQSTYQASAAPSKIQLEFLVSSQETAELLKSALSTRIKDLKVASSKTESDNRIRIQYTGSMMEGGYGKSNSGR